MLSKVAVKPITSTTTNMVFLVKRTLFSFMVYGSKINEGLCFLLIRNSVDEHKVVPQTSAKYIPPS